jgi:hypothetical protein
MTPLRSLAHEFEDRLKQALPPVARCSRCGREYQGYPRPEQPCPFPPPSDPAGALCGGPVVLITQESHE